MPQCSSADNHGAGNDAATAAGMHTALLDSSAAADVERRLPSSVQVS